jgi:ABC-type branched-subunit amino acid transport system ATPase component
MAVALADRIAVLGMGQVQWTGSADQLLWAQDVIQTWLAPASEDGHGGAMPLSFGP